MNICVIGGAGYVGVVTSACLSQIGHNIISVDVDQKRVDLLQTGNSPIYEDGLDELLSLNIEAGRIDFTTKLSEAVKASDVIFIAVGTPSLSTGMADMSQVIQAMEDISVHLNSYKIIAIRSTVPLDGFENIRSILSRNKIEGKDFDIVSNPEFLREGKGIEDFFLPDRIIIGADSRKAVSVIRELYEPIIIGDITLPAAINRSAYKNNVPVVETTIQTAQMIKYASNAFLATRISFINEIADICEEIDADVSDVVKGIGYDSRIGHSHLSPGPGFGGPCLEKDLRAIVSYAESTGLSLHFLQAILERNARQIDRLVEKLEPMLDFHVSGKTVAILGLAFKAGTNDTRNSPALKVIELLSEQGALVRVYDPVAMPKCSEQDNRVTYCSDPYVAVQGADALLIMTEWKLFEELDYIKIKSRMTSPRIVDGRNLLDPCQIVSLGFEYTGVGR